MAVITEYQQRTRASGASFPGGTSAGQGLFALGKAAESISQDLRVIEEQDAALWATSALSEAQIQWQKELNDRQQSAEPGAENFTGQTLEDFDEYSAKVQETAPSGIAKQFIAERLAAYRTQLALTALGYEAVEKSRHTVDTVENSIESGRIQARQDPDRFGELLAERLATIDALRLDPEAKRSLRESAQQTIARDAVIGMIDANPVDALELLKTKLGESDNAAIESLTPDDRLRLEEMAEVSVAQGLLEAEEAKQAAIDRVASELELDVFRGNGLRTDIDLARDSDVITPAKWTQLHLEMDRQEAEAVADAKLRQLVSISTGLGIPLDPGDPDHRKAVELAYTDIPGEPFSPVHNAATGQLVKQTGIVPKQVKSMVRSMAVAGNATQAMAMADLVDHIQTVSPSAISQFSTDEKAFALQVQEFVRAGTEPAGAVELARERVFKTSPAERDIVAANYRDESGGNEDALDDLIDDDFDNLFPFNQPDAPPLLQAEFERLSETYFLKTHEINAARSLAWQDLQSVWGVSTINGSRQLMKYPPEARGEIDRDDLPENALVISDPRTARDGTYSIVVIGDDDLPRIQTFRWEPNVKAPEDYQSTVDEARASRKLLAEIQDKAQRRAQSRVDEVRRITELQDKPQDLAQARVDEIRRSDVSNIKTTAGNVSAIIDHAQSNVAAGTTVTNSDGRPSSVRSMSVEVEELNNGQPTLIPSVWNGRIVGSDKAIELAIASGKQWPAFSSNEKADAASKKISLALGAMGRKP